MDSVLSYLEQCRVVNTKLYKAKKFHHFPVISDNAHDTRFLFRTMLLSLAAKRLHLVRPLEQFIVL